MTRQPKFEGAKKPSKKKSRETATDMKVYQSLTRTVEGNEFHDDKNFSRFFKDMCLRFPKLKEHQAEQATDKNDVLNLEKANEVFHAVVSAALTRRLALETRMTRSSIMGQ